MARKLIAIKNNFNDVVRINPKTFSYFAVWDQGHHINFWDKAGPCIGDLPFTPDTFDTESEQVVLQLRGNGIDFIRLASDIDPDGVTDDGYRFYYRPEFIQYFEDDAHKESPSHAVALSIGGIPFYLSEDEKADFKHTLFSKTPANDWLQFSKDPGAQFNGASGHYAFRKSLITDIFANPEDGLLAIQTPDRYRSFVPMPTPNKSSMPWLKNCRNWSNPMPLRPRTRCITTRPSIRRGKDIASTLFTDFRRIIGRY